MLEYMPIKSKKGQVRRKKGNHFQGLGRGRKYLGMTLFLF